MRVLVGVFHTMLVTVLVFHMMPAIALATALVIVHVFVTVPVTRSLPWWPAIRPVTCHQRTAETHAG